MKWIFLGQKKRRQHRVASILVHLYRACAVLLFNICQNNQPKDWEKKVMDSQRLPFIFFPDCIPKNPEKDPNANADTNPFSFLPLHYRKTAN